ncbi:hypothetical protein B484DRAFT_405375 [Ochromonadaceae sp. CCMP2298]|nr:hypothetical protein B484DRAFT_405375 [Ochromonadaceae sp. CCMP2298]
MGEGSDDDECEVEMYAAFEDWDLEACELAEEPEREPPEPPPQRATTTEGRVELPSEEQRRSVARIAVTISQFFPERPAQLSEFEAVALRAFSRADLDYNIDDAVREAGEFHMAEENCTRDCAEFDRRPVDGEGMVNIAAMVEDRKVKPAPNWLSRERVVRTLSRDNPHYAKVMALAVDGIRVRELLPEDFEPAGPQRSKWPPQRPKFLKAAAAVETLLQKNFVYKGLATRVVGLSIHPSGWAPKAKKLLGRNTGDPVRMNTRHTKLAADEEWGVISHPTIEQVVNMVLDYAEQEGIDWEDLVLIKLYITGAYTLIFIKMEDAALFGTEVTREKIQQVIKGKFGMYVDDILLATTRQHEAHDTGAASSKVQGLLGEGCLEEDKKERGRRVTIVGFDLDLNQRLLAISDRCVERAVGGFMKVDEERPLSVLMRALLMLTVVYEKGFARNFDSWTEQKRGEHVVVRFDAALPGLGMLWYLKQASGTEMLLGGAASDIRFLDFGTDSGLQNVAEFLAIICAIWGLFMLELGGLRVNGAFPSRIVLEGDSALALAWAEKGRVLLGKHVPAKENGKTDYMSRLSEDGKDWEGLAKEYPDLADMPILDLKVDDHLLLARPGDHTESSVKFMSM